MVSLRIAFILITLLAVAVPASAEEDPYYLRASVGPADGPREANGGDDCAPKRSGPSDVNESAHRIADPVLDNPPQPFGFHGVSDWFPKCTSVNTATPEEEPCDPSTGTGCGPQPGICITPLGCPPGSRASYNMTSGRLFIAHGLDTSMLNVLGATGLQAQVHVPDSMTVSTGIGLQADCEQCPPVP